MHEAALNPALIRLVLIVLFVLVFQVLRAAKMFQSAKPPLGANTGKGSQLEALREAMRQAAEQARARQSGLSVDQEPTPGTEQFQQPATIGPESSFIPSLLLVALLACLILMAYRHWGG